MLSPEQVLAEIPLQREQHWPDFHPETYCHLCGRPNITSWWVGSAEAWLLAVEDLPRGVNTILCPQCFTSRWESRTGLLVSWEIRLDSETVWSKVRNLMRFWGWSVPDRWKEIG